MTQPEIDPRFVKMAEKSLPCTCSAVAHDYPQHFAECHVNLRETFALRLQEQFSAEDIPPDGKMPMTPCPRPSGRRRGNVSV